MRTIDKTWAMAQAKNEPFPLEFLVLRFTECACPRLWLQGDNACKEVRNSWTGKWQCLLAQAKLFTCASHSHLQVGHTHEDVGQALCFFAIPVVLDGVFSICTSALNAERELFTPRDVQRTGLV